MKHDSKKYLENSSKDMDDALVKACLKGSPQALQLYYKVMGRLVEKTEITERRVITADEHFKMLAEAEQRIKGLEESEDRVTQVPKKIREDIEDVDWDKNEV